MTEEKMTQDEIAQVKETVVQENSEKVDTIGEENAIYSMAESEGWRLMMKKANRMIVALLEPIDSTAVPSNADLATIGANTLANAKSLKVLREFVNYAEVIKNARREEDKRKKAQEESKKEA